MSDQDRQDDIRTLRELLDLMENFTDNDQRARYLLSSNWLRERGAAAAARAQADLEDIQGRVPRDRDA